MVVDADDGAGGFADGDAENFARMGERAVGGARSDFLAAQEPVAAVETENPELLYLETTGERLHVADDQFGASQEGRLAGLLAEHSAGDFDNGDELEDFDRSNTFVSLKVDGGPADEPGERTGVGDQTLSER